MPSVWLVSNLYLVQFPPPTSLEFSNRHPPPILLTLVGTPSVSSHGHCSGVNRDNQGSRSHKTDPTPPKQSRGLILVSYMAF